MFATLKKLMAGLSDYPDGAQVVVLVAYGEGAPDGFEALARAELEQRLRDLRTEAHASGSPRVLCLHVRHDTVPPLIVQRVADVVLDVRRARHG